MKIGVLHKAVIHKKELFTVCSSCILGFSDESFYYYQACFCLKGYKILVDLFPEYSYYSLPGISGSKIVYLTVVMMKRKPYVRMSYNYLLKFINYMPDFSIIRFKKFTSGRDIEKKILN